MSATVIRSDVCFPNDVALSDRSCNININNGYRFEPFNKLYENVLCTLKRLTFARYYVVIIIIILCLTNICTTYRRS